MNALPEHGVILPTLFELFITFFLIIFCSDTLGIMISCIVKTSNTAMTVMPFILILQLVISGMIFELSGFTETISNLTISKWGLNAICITANVNEMFSFVTYNFDDYIYTSTHIFEMWFMLIIFIFVYCIISISCLEFVDRDKR